ncbi:MAG TPA: MFS transporter [Caldithrix abyssi]|uniref:MFS transporter n=1 Tax=Caldithrix abyssi TaxID=187145 RepID=A0A7V5LKT0_CALAY|nr:MFS transporter [Caldithrix abyssi]
MDSTDKAGRSVLRNRNLHIIFGVTLMAVLGVSSITPAFPVMSKALHINPRQIGLLITVFTLPGIFLTPFLGMLADRYGRKKILIPSLILFAVAGASCAFLQTFNGLLIARFFQGVGATSLGALNVTLIGDLFRGRQRAAAMGYNASVLSVGTASYPTIGGSLALFGWHYPFLLPLFALPIAFVVLFFLETRTIEKTSTLKNYLLMALKAMSQRQVISLYLASLMTFIILYGAYLTYFPLLLNLKFQANSFVIGIIMSSMSATTALTSWQLGRLTRMFSEKSLIKVSYILYTLSLLIIPQVTHEYLFLLATILFGMAQGINIPSIQTLLAGLAPEEYRAIFMSVNGMVLRLGQTIGPLLAGLFFALWGLDGTFLSSAALAALLGSILFFLIP